MAEDDVELARMHQMKLESDGYDVTLAFDGETALRLAQETAPEIILLDVQMPRLDGLAVLRSLRRSPRTRHIPTVMFSNVSDPEVIEACLMLGVIDYIGKSEVTPGELSTRLRKLVADARPRNLRADTIAPVPAEPAEAALALRRVAIRLQELHQTHGNQGSQP